MSCGNDEVPDNVALCPTVYQQKLMKYIVVMMIDKDVATLSSGYSILCCAFSSSVHTLYRPGSDLYIVDGLS